MKAKKMICLLLSCMTIVGLMPMTASAADLDVLMINGVNIFDEPNQTIQCGGGTAVYDSGSNTLTLNNAEIEQNSALPVINVHGELTINLVGENKITTTTSRPIYGNQGDLKFSGGGHYKLTLNQTVFSQIFSEMIL